jgi:drug/metabolite transporter (DMT)-like permease
LLYTLALHRLKVGVALVLIFLGPMLVAIWARVFGKRSVHARFWAATALSVIGLILVARVWDRFSLDGLGVAFALSGAAAYAFYVLFAEHAVGRRDPLSLLAFGFLFACLVWTVVQPWWSLPWHVLADQVSLQGHLAGTSVPEWLLIAWVVALGTVVPFILIVGSLQHLPATRVAICGMLEPVVATIVAYGWLGETLTAAQLVGGAIVLAAIALAQTAR